MIFLILLFFIMTTAVVAIKPLRNAVTSIFVKTPVAAPATTQAQSCPTPTEDDYDWSDTKMYKGSEIIAALTATNTSQENFTFSNQYDLHPDQYYIKGIRKPHWEFCGSRMPIIYYKAYAV